MMMANSSLFGAGTPAPAPVTSLSVPVAATGTMASIAHGGAAPQPATETGAVAATAPDFAALLALNILGAMPDAALPGAASTDGGADMSGDAGQDDGLPADTSQEPLAMALLALNGVVLPMTSLAPVLAPLPTLPSSPHANDAAAGMTLSATSAATGTTATALNALAASSPDAMAMLMPKIGEISPAGGGLVNAPVAISVPEMSPDLPAAAIFDNSGQPQWRVALVDGVLPAPASSAASDAGLPLDVMPAAMPAPIVPAPAATRAKMANGPSVPAAALPDPAGPLAVTSDVSAGKTGASATGLSDAAASRLPEFTAPVSGPQPASLNMTVSGIAVARADVAMPSTDPALGEAVAVQLPVERQLDLARHDRWVNDLARDIAASAGSDGKMSFRLDPPQLGRLAVMLQQGEAGLSVRLDAETAEATQIISQAQPRLMEDLRQQGVRIADASVGTQTGQHQNQSQHQNQQQNQGHQGQNLAQANSGQQDQPRQQSRTFDLNGDQPVPQAETNKAAPVADAHGRVA